MKNTRNIGIVVAILGLLLTCCLCPLALESLGTLSRINRGVGLYGRFFPRIAVQVQSAQVTCSGVLALIVLIIGIVVFVQARGNGSGGSSTTPQ